MGITTIVAALLMAMPPSFSTKGDPANVEVRLVLDKASPLWGKNGPVTESAGAKALTVGVFDEKTKMQGGNLFGTYHTAEGVLVFTPRHPLSPGMTYRASATPGGAALWPVPKGAAQKPVEVVRIYPGGDFVPANLLKFTIVFSGPMRQSKDIFDHIHLVAQDGSPVDDPWRRTELWSDGETRLNLWFHPGRVKLGVNLREQLGPPLSPQGKYELRITEALLDASGNPLSKRFVKKFQAIEERRGKIDVAKWKLEQPAPESSDPLKVHFPFPLDPFLLAREMELTDASGGKIKGMASVPAGELAWWFSPRQPWKRGDYILKVGAEVADLSGNTLSRPFEVDLEAPSSTGSPKVLRFSIK